MLHQIKWRLLGCTLVFCGATFQSLGGPDLAIEASASPDPAAVGQDLKYTVAIVNNGDATAAGVLVTNRLDASLSIKTVNPSHGTVSISGTTIVNSIAALAAQERATIEITAVPMKATVLVFDGWAMISPTEEKLYDNYWGFFTDAIGVPNSPPSITIESPLENAELNSGDDLNITATSNDSDGTVQKVEFYLQDVKIAEKTEPPFELKVPALRPGVFTLTVRTTDNLEAVAAAQCHITSSGAGTNRFLFPKYENGLFQAFFSAHYFDDFAIEAKSAQGNWNEIGRLTRTNFSGVIVDPNADGQSRLYRAVQISQ